jgi:RNA polymerase sigma factor (sigma-70 family)
MRKRRETFQRFKKVLSNTRNPRLTKSVDARLIAPMEPTALSLLDRLRQTPESEDWERFVTLYRPFIERFIRRDPALAADADDICQEVFAKVVGHVGNFTRRRDGSFRVWLRTITANEVNLFYRKRQRERRANFPDGSATLESLAEPTSDLTQAWDREYCDYLLCRLQSLVRDDFSPTTWEAFRLRVLEEKSTAEVAAKLGMSKNAVDVAKSRVLARLRREAVDLLDT